VYIVFDKSDPCAVVWDVASQHGFHVILNEVEGSKPSVAFQTLVSRLVPRQTFVSEREVTAGEMPDS